MLHPQRVFLHLKKCRDMSSEGCAIHPVSHNSLLQIKMAISRIIFKFEHVTCEETCCLAHFKFKKVLQTAINFCNAPPHLSRSLSRIICRGQEGPKYSKGTLRLDLQVKYLN
jgi:hypothetical protein